MPSDAELLEKAKRYLYPNYRQPDLVMSHGKGAQLWDQSGKRYLDLYAGIAVSTLGHAHPALVQALADQAGRVIHLSNYYYNAPNILLAEKLCTLSGMSRAFFCNSGTEAMEAMLKMCRRHFFAAGQTERYRMIAFDSSFHGRSLGALSLTGQKKYRDGFGPLPGVTHVPYGDLDAVERELGPDVAGIVVEPVQGEGGVVPAPSGFLRGLRTLTEQHGALLLADEIQTGVGRTGRFLACQHDDVVPDAVSLAKGLAGGVPIGVMLCGEHLKDALPPGSHGTTFGGNPLASHAALCVLSLIESENLMLRARESGEFLKQQLGQLADKHAKHVELARGSGLLWAIVLRADVDARAFVGAMRDAGVLVTLAGGQGVRLSPALTITQDELAEGIAVLDQVLGEL
ncbi:MAG TPA: acetylornithine/succinylornithine family transaminase [Polyangiaceae bacterium]|nr:acetylornithine/succinylornithine family transaminase [Polyangiaceae bacterium]HMR75527.1 acetylornithine/succinylornithine family transaminase [Polyangiaceae bacterium]